MKQEQLDIKTNVPVLSWAGHELDRKEMVMAQNVASLPFVYKHVALMPDVHLGKGALVGSVIATNDAIIPAAVGVDIGCFIGDTLIPLVNGYTFEIKELAESDQEFLVYACNSLGEIVTAKATARLTRKKAALVKVTLNNGEEIICTPDHQFMLSDGTYQEAQNLREDTSLMSFNPQLKKGEDNMLPVKELSLVTSSKFRPITTPKHQPLNYQVVTVLPLNYQEDVYCLTVPKYHNFALKAGVFVHNCGMMAVKTPFNSTALEGKLKKIRLEIEAEIPVGFEDNKKIHKEVNNWQGWKYFKDLHKGVKDLEGKAIRQMGSLGGGNHFIEVCLDTEDQVWLMLHSGSRNIGNKVAQCHIQTAKHLARLTDTKLPDPDLAYFLKGTAEFAAYWQDLQWAQNYAKYNRDVMMNRFIHIIEKHLNGGKKFKPLLMVNCHHNYAEKEVHFGEEVYVTRKGAVRAKEEDYGIIPGSMGTKSYIVKGKGNIHSFCSCSHGAGRQMSRSKAKDTFSLDDFLVQTQGVECRKDRGLIDEIPGAYKPIEKVMEQQSDLVEIVATLKQVICVKG